MVYSDSDRLLSVADDLQMMIATEPAVLRRFPALDEHMRQFPRPPEAGTDDIIYWSKEKLVGRIILSVTHLAITKLAALASRRCPPRPSSCTVPTTSTRPSA